MRTWALGCSTKTFLSKKKCRVMAGGQFKLVPIARRYPPSERGTSPLVRVT